MCNLAFYKGSLARSKSRCLLSYGKWVVDSWVGNKQISNQRILSLEMCLNVLTSAISFSLKNEAELGCQISFDTSFRLARILRHALVGWTDKSEI